jgi:type IV secretory pathway VirB4 component
VFNNRSNINIDNRLVCFDIKNLKGNLKKVGMLIIQETMWNRVSINRSLGKITRLYMDEFHLLLRDQQTASYSAEIWKRFRKWNGFPVGITQNVKDLLMSEEISNIFSNTDFFYLLSQSPDDREILMDKLKISPQQAEFITNSDQGCGLIKYGEVIVPFVDLFPKNTKLYALMTSKVSEIMANKENIEKNKLAEELVKV